MRMSNKNTYICKHLPDALVKALDNDYRDMVSAHVGKELKFVAGGMAITHAEIKMDANILPTTYMQSPDVKLVRGNIEAHGEIHFMLVGRGEVEGGR